MPGPSVVRLVAIALGLGAARLAAQNEIVRVALRDELARTMQTLHLDTMPGPYFVSYRVDDVELSEVSATRGSLLASDSTRGRRLITEVRVGGYSFDNTNFFGFPTGSDQAFRVFAGGFDQLPLDDDYGEIRRRVWLATDQAYKNALEQLSRKRAAVQNLTRRDSVADFSREGVAVASDSTGVAASSRSVVESLVRDLSALFRDLPVVYDSRVEWTSRVVRTIYINSEGTSFFRVSPRVTLKATARALAADGTPLEAEYHTSGSSLFDLPGRDSLLNLVRRLGDRLSRLRSTEAAESYNGPVLFTDEAAADLFRALLAPRLLAARHPVVDNAMLEQMFTARDRSGVDDIGTRVLPRFLSVIDDPSLRSWHGRFVGGFRVDDDGVPTHATRVVDHGVLKVLLTTRTPIRGAPNSTGNRWGHGPTISTLIVTADSALSDDALRRKLLELVKARGAAYGVIVYDLEPGSVAGAGNPSAFMQAMVRSQFRGGLATLVASRLYLDGHEEPIRDAEIVTLAPASLKDIVAVSQASVVSLDPTGALGGFAADLDLGMAFTLGLGSAYESAYVVPAVLLEDISIRRTRGEVPRPPVLGPPWIDQH